MKKPSLLRLVLVLLLAARALPVTLAAQVQGSELRLSQQRGSLVIDWDERATTGVLQAARDPAGPWQIVTGASAPYRTLPAGPHRFYRLGPGDVTGPGGVAGETFAARHDAKMGNWFVLPQDDWMFTRGQRWTHIRSGLQPTAPNYRSMSGHFLTARDQTPIAIFFTAEAYVDTVDKRLFVRALVDGVPLAPADVVFATGVSPVNPETRAFIFSGRVDEGLHTVELQWQVDREATAYIRDASFLVRQGDSPNSDGSLVVFNPPSGPPVSTTSGAWADVPGLGGVVQTAAGETLAISVSAESYVTGTGTMFLRALVDGQPAKPADVLFAKGSRPQSRTMTFGLTAPAPGLHTVQIQWLADQGGAFVGDRTLVLAATPRGSANIAQVLVLPASGPPDMTSSKTFTPMPEMSVAGKLTPNCEVAVLLSAITGVPANESLHVQLKIDGTAVANSEVQLAESSLHVGAHTFLFSAKHLYPDGPPALSTISLEWRTENGQAVSLDDRSMVVLVKPPTVPDLVEPPLYGSGNFRIESALGVRRVLTILWNADRPGHPQFAAAAAQQGVFGAAASIQHYYSVISGGKYTLSNPLGGNNVLGWYAAKESSTNYFGDPGAGCGGDFTGTPNGMDRRRREALERAAQDIDFASFDDNGDGVLDPQLELAILLVMPDSGAPSGKVRQVFDNNCSTLEVDGVIVPLIAELLSNFTGAGFMVGAHELAHLLFGLDDNYLSNAINTGAGRLSLMEQFGVDHTPHPDPFNKLALGWVTPRIVEQDGLYSLRDVKKSQEVILLPRKPGKADDEYYILENRQDAPDHLLYDKSIFDSGIAVWHVVENSADNGLPPVCQTAMQWAETGNGNARRGNRLVRPQILYSNVNSLWSSEHYNLLDAGSVCPASGDNPAARRNVLQWADGAPSGFNLINWSAAAETMTFQVIAP